MFNFLRRAGSSRITEQRRYVRSSQDKPLSGEEVQRRLREPGFWKGWKEHLERCQAEERKRKLNTPVVFFDEV